MSNFKTLSLVEREALLEREQKTFLLEKEEEFSDIKEMHKLAVKLYGFTVPSERKLVSSWNDVSWSMNQLYRKLLYDVSKWLSVFIDLHPSLSDCEVEEASRNSTLINFFFWTSEYRFNLTLPGTPWDSSFSTREVSIVVPANDTRFSVFPCTRKEYEFMGRTENSRRRLELDVGGTQYDMDFYCETPSEVVEQILRLIAVPSFSALHEEELKKFLDHFNNPVRYTLCDSCKSSNCCSKQQQTEDSESELEGKKKNNRNRRGRRKKAKGNK
jgi:hypothetical protein